MPCDMQCKYGLGHQSSDTLEREDGQWMLSIFMQSGRTSGFMEHDLFRGKYVQWVVVIELPSSIVTDPKYHITPWFLDVVS